MIRQRILNKSDLLNSDKFDDAEHFIKDLGIAIAECKRMNLDLPGLNLSMELYEKTRGLGYGKLGTQALFLALKEISEN